MPATWPAFTVKHLLAALILSVLSSPAVATPSTTRCGQYTIQVTDLKTGDEFSTQQHLTLSGPGGRVAVLEDAGAGVDWCRDTTGDRVPEVLLYAYSGGAHCCFTHTIYSLGTPPRKLLEVGSGDVDSIRAEQLDGTGPLELITYDPRFAYAFGMSFAESPFLTVVYSFIGGRYVNDSRSFPAVILKESSTSGRPVTTTDLLKGVASLIVTGRSREVEPYLRLAPAGLQAWMRSYLPDVRQALADYGLDDWPLRAGIPEAARTVWGAGGSFTGAGTSQYVAVLRGDGNTLGLAKGARGLVLLRRDGKKVLASRPLVTLTGSGDWWPQFTVRRAGGRDDLVVRDKLSGSVRYPVYRFDQSNATMVKDDSLAVFAGMLADLTRAANANESLLDTSVRRTPAQLAELSSRAATFRQAVGQWLASSNPRLAAERLAAFDVHAIEAVADTSDKARWRATLDLGSSDASSYQGYVPTERHELIASLEKSGGGWRVTALTIKRIVEAPPP